MFPVLQIGPLALQTSGLALLAGLWIGLSLAEQFAPKRGIQSNALYNLVFIALACGAVGARLGYVLRYTAVFAENPASLLSLNPGLLSPGDGMVTAALGAWVYGHRKGLPLWNVLDVLTPVVAVMAAAVGISHLASGAAFGSATEMPWGLELWGARRHPTQVYEILAALLILAILWPGRKQVQSWPPGRYFLSFLAASAGARLFLEAFRGDSTLLPGGFRMGQILAWLVLLGSLWGVGKLRNHKPIQQID